MGCRSFCQTAGSPKLLADPLNSFSNPVHSSCGKWKRKTQNETKKPSRCDSERRQIGNIPKLASILPQWWRFYDGCLAFLQWNNKEREAAIPFPDANVNKLHWIETREGRGDVMEEALSLASANEASRDGAAWISFRIYSRCWGQQPPWRRNSDSFNVADSLSSISSS